MRRRPPPVDLFRRLLAAGMTALVFALTVFAASPVAHDLLHKQDAPRGDDRCAVTLFASSASIPLDAIAVLPPSTTQRAPLVVAVEEILLTAPRYLRQPERGPPVRWVS